MKNFKYIITFIAILSFSNSIKAQQLSDKAEISIITCSSGDELYSTFGHSAIRVCDTLQNLDIIFNYGTFDFNTPNFYVKFLSGTLMYSLSSYGFSDFMNSYVYENRSVYQQILNITYEEKTRLFALLLENYEPQNRNYRYDFFRDNCSTRIRDILLSAFGEKLQFTTEHKDNPQSFRNLLAPHLSNMSWTKFGIDMALGLPADEIASDADHMFLPEGLQQNIDGAKLNGKSLAFESQTIFKATATIPQKPSPINPTSIAFAFATLVLIISMWEFNCLRNKKKFSFKLFDRIFFFSMAVVGVYLIVMWIVSLHYTFHNNLNILWLNPLYLYVFWKLERSNIYILTICIICNLVVLSGILPQQFNIAFAPIIFAAFLRLVLMTIKQRKIKVKKLEDN